MVGRKFGRLLVTARAPNDRWRAARWYCRCECGNSTVVTGSDLRSGHTVSCGCWNADRFSAVGKSNRTHGHSQITRTYRIWGGMKRRCLNRNDPAFPHYGGRGIKVCDRWMAYANFLADMGECPPGFSIERINVNGNYEPENCKWIPQSDQQNNRTDSQFLVFRGEKMTVSQFARLVGIKVELTVYRITRRGWTPERASHPPRAQSRKSP